MPRGLLEGEQVPAVLADAGHAVLGTEALEIVLHSHGQPDVEEANNREEGNIDDPALDAGSAVLYRPEEAD